MSTITVRADEENGAEEFWTAVDALGTELGARLDGVRDGGSVTVTASELAELQALPGWDDGPEYAQHPLCIGDEIRVGSRVTGGDTDEDRDTGEVLQTFPDGQLEVAWEGAGCRTTISASIVEVVS